MRAWQHGPSDEADSVGSRGCICRYWPTQGWQDFMYAGLRDHFHYHRDIVANASRLAHHLHRK